MLGLIHPDLEPLSPAPKKGSSALTPSSPRGVTEPNRLRRRARERQELKPGRKRGNRGQRKRKQGRVHQQNPSRWEQTEQREAHPSSRCCHFSPGQSVSLYSPSPRFTLLSSISQKEPLSRSNHIPLLFKTLSWCLPPSENRFSQVP